ncbi:MULTISPECIES: hypothetical protein [unclassified Klebsiella]|uniref:hypothetical protein n=1 Tax=unclassified Klebsiella TaxID=2608929 RepID=UPI0015DD18A2|nr:MULTISPECIES: hypothetical protein [unclassified Klebsiella]BBQ86616.1 hypothetical protein WP3W18E02_P20300 [Klebsiella sp. WP3-W18-ESBL-02]BBR23767.1 hypothetical protein WP3S18E05_P21020 [Klebsiella sp. WP3-S18-ESBL-05]
MNSMNNGTQQAGFDVFFREDACKIYSFAITLNGASEPVALCNFENLARLQAEFPDMVLISEDEANQRVAKKAADKQLAEEAATEAASRKTSQETGHQFIRINAGRP